MLKSIDFINRLEIDLQNNIKEQQISDYSIELRVNHKLWVNIVSDDIKEKKQLLLKTVKPDELNNQNILFKFLSSSLAQDEDYRHLFESEKKVSFGLRRSLGTLFDLNKDDITCTQPNIITFFSYKGGVGRTTSLALLATYLARQGKNVFVVDCDFEAPGLINFFNSSQNDKHKSGLVEYLNDKQFLDSPKLTEYIYNIEKVYSGNGIINLLPAGNIFSSDKKHLDSYLEGIAKLDLQGTRLTKVFTELFADINSNFRPDVILVDSRTGFNNVFGALAQLSQHVVFLSGDDFQNQPGLEYVNQFLSDAKVDVSHVLSIISSGFTRRFNNFRSNILGDSTEDTGVNTFYFDRQQVLENIGTLLQDQYDLDDFINGEAGSAQYHKFFKYLEQIVDSIDDENETPIEVIESNFETIGPLPNNTSTATNVEQVSAQKDTVENSEEAERIQDRILNSLESNLPNLYAENTPYDQNFFFVRPCMEDFLIPEKVILLGDKGTGKTAFYKALQNNEFFQDLIIKAQKKHLNYKILNITNFDDDKFEFLGFEKYVKDELFIKKFWLFFIWNALCTRNNHKSSDQLPTIDLSSITSAPENIIEYVNNNENMKKIESELENINENYRLNDKRLIITFDRLDDIVKPHLWNDVISPLVKLSIRFPWSNIFPKLFLRRDLYQRLGNLTNKNAFESRVINLEWSKNEIFSYFLKILFVSCKEDLFQFLTNQGTLKPLFLSDLRKKLKTRNVQHNQLPLSEHLISPIVNSFFGSPKPRKNGTLSTAYEDLYRNIQSTDNTVNIRPFVDLIHKAIESQKEDDCKKGFRKNAVLGIAYCTSAQVRKAAVVNYLTDLWTEKGNEFVKSFCEYFTTGEVDKRYKKNQLDEQVLEELLLRIQDRYSDSEAAIQESNIEELKQVLIANKIITQYLVGNKTRYRFAYLYTSYLGVYG